MAQGDQAGRHRGAVSDPAPGGVDFHRRPLAETWRSDQASVRLSWGGSSACSRPTWRTARTAAASARSSRPTCGGCPDVNGPEDRWCLANARASVPWQPVIEKILTHLGLQARAPPNRDGSDDLAIGVAGLGCAREFPEQMDVARRQGLTRS